MIPTDANLSPPATNIIKRLITDVDNRLGKNWVNEIKRHPFFKGIDWVNIRQVQAPNIPQITSEISNENFDKFEEASDAEERKYPKRQGKRLDVDFIDYTYKADVEHEKLLLVNVLKDLDTIVSDSD